MSRAGAAHARRGWIVVFAKDPRPGLVKTRLCPPLSPRQAADLYRCMLEDALDVTASAAVALDYEPVLAITPGAAAASLARRAPPGVRVIDQGEGELGARMVLAARRAAAAGASRVVLRGSDSPALGAAELAETAHALDGADVAVRPDADGGYHAIALGLRALERGLGAHAIFDHPMSTPTVLADTLARARALGLDTQRLDAGFDVDRWADVERLCTLRQRRPAIPCPRTLAYLDEGCLGVCQERDAASGPGTR